MIFHSCKYAWEHLYINACIWVFLKQHPSVNEQSLQGEIYPIIYLSSLCWYAISLSRTIIMSCYATLHCRYSTTHLVVQGQWWRLQSAHCCACRFAASWRSNTFTLTEAPTRSLSALPLNKCSWLIHCSTDWSWTRAKTQTSWATTHTQACSAHGWVKKKEVKF